MVAKGAWLNRPAIIRQARQTNRYDVQREKLIQLGTALQTAVARGRTTITIDILYAIKELP